MSGDKQSQVRQALEQMLTVRNAAEAKQATDRFATLGLEMADLLGAMQQLKQAQAQAQSAIVPPEVLDKVAEELCRPDPAASAEAQRTLSLAGEIMFFMSIRREGAAAFQVVDHLLQNMAHHADVLAEGDWGSAGPFWAEIATELRDRLAESQGTVH